MQVSQENKLKEEGRKEGGKNHKMSQKSLIHFHFQNLMVREVGEQAGSRKLQCMEGCITLSVSITMDIVELKCSKCRDEK